MDGTKECIFFLPITVFLYFLALCVCFFLTNFFLVLRTMLFNCQSSYCRTENSLRKFRLRSLEKLVRATGRNRLH